MKKISLMLMAAVIASFFIACGDSGANMAGKPANSAANNANMASAPADPKVAEAEVRKVMEAVKDGLSRNDADAMDKVYADNYMIVNADGSVMTKAERLDALRKGDLKYTSFAYSDENIRVSPDGNSAVGIFKISSKGTMKGKPMDGDYRTTGVFAKTKDGWRLMSASNVKMEAGAAKPEDKAKANANTKEAAPQKATGNAKIDSMAADDIPAPKNAASPKKK
jgi:ketosteroid isomerase-like protein